MSKPLAWKYARNNLRSCLCLWSSTRSWLPWKMNKPPYFVARSQVEESTESHFRYFISVIILVSAKPCTSRPAR